MARSGFDRPTKAEMSLRRRLNDVTHRLKLYEADATGRAVISEQEERISALEEQLASDTKQINKLKAQCANLKDKNALYKQQLASQKRQIAALRMDVKVAHGYGRDLERKCALTEKRRFEWAAFARKVVGTLAEVRAENRTLKARLNRNPQNSSLPPSSSPLKKVHNSRVKTGRHTGAQPGHTGHARRQYVPDETVVIGSVEVCPCCGSHDLVHDEATTRCITDIAAILQTIAYNANSSVCMECGALIEAPFPAGVVNEQNYGDNIRATVTYLANRCNVSAANVTDFLYEATGHALKVSVGSVYNFLSGFSKKAEGVLAGLEGELKASCVIGSDATHTSAAGRQTYVYAYVSDDTAIYQASAVKGNAPLASSPIADFKGTVVHDHDRAYYNYGTAHAECNAHVLRALKGVEENEPERTWAAQMRALLSEAHGLAGAAREAVGTAITEDAIRDITSRFDAIIGLAESEYGRDGPFKDKYKPEGIALYKRLQAFRDNHLLFLRDPSVPYSNNFSERALRRVKMKTKQSGGFRSYTSGQEPYCDFLSITQTASMRGMEVLGAVRSVFNGKHNLFVKQTSPPEGPAP